MFTQVILICIGIFASNSTFVHLLYLGEKAPVPFCVIYKAIDTLCIHSSCVNFRYKMPWIALHLPKKKGKKLYNGAGLFLPG